MLLRKIIWTLSFIPQFFEGLFILFVRFLEFQLTGQSSYKIHRTNLSLKGLVQDMTRAKVHLEDVKKYMAQKFEIELKSPVILELYSGEEYNLKGIIMELRGSLGRYHFENMGKSGIAHMVYIKKGLDRNRFRTVLAHELAHAYLREKRLMNCDRFLREGFARWIEYKYLTELGEIEEANKIKNIKTYQYGKLIEKFIEIENQFGEENVMESVCKMK
ncbi:MAG: hypothetical protein ACLFQV_13715 [Vulcanimicrobiota bacterium]